MLKVDSVFDFKVVADERCRRINVFGTGCGYTLPERTYDDVFPDVETKDGDDDALDIDVETLRVAASFVVWDDDLEKLAHYFYNLGKEHAALEAKK